MSSAVVLSARYRGRGERGERVKSEREGEMISFLFNSSQFLLGETSTNEEKQETICHEKTGQVKDDRKTPGKNQ